MKVAAAAFCPVLTRRGPTSSYAKETLNNGPLPVSDTDLPCESRLHRHIAAFLSDVMCNPFIRAPVLFIQIQSTEQLTLRRYTPHRYAVGNTQRDTHYCSWCH